MPAKPHAVIRRTPEDFVVREIPAYEPTGEGEHLFVTFSKRDVTTPEAVRRICAALAVDARAAGFAGMKDKRAVTTQTMSLPFARGRAIADVRALALEGIQISHVARHPHKLKPGHLKGNQFDIVLRDLPVQEIDRVRTRLAEVGEEGFPNTFGPQRFGRHGDNPAVALGWLLGRGPGPKDRRMRRFLFSSLQAHLFNQVLERREGDGTWNRTLLGDLVKKTDTGGLFLCTDPRADEERAARGEISPTGPIFGAKMRWPEGKPAEIEREILERATAGIDPWERHRALGEGTRRPLRLLASELRVENAGEHPDALSVHFVLPKGGYATTLLACVVTLYKDATQEEEMAAE
jgi:tRNA pseudouridine13 synthase